MSELSEKELLLLSNYVYMDSAVTQGTIGETLELFKNAEGSFDIEKIQGAGVGGGMSANEAAVLFAEMDSASAEFKDLEAVRIVNDGGIRAVCYAQADSSEAAVIFRGTGGEYHAWTDNVYGEYCSDTEMQKYAAEFIQSNCGVYENITVSGHSKGGNLAQYVTVACPEKIDRCVSYDGQGFGAEFFEENGEAAKAAAEKITSISAHNDFVNILLTPIAGRRVFVENEGTGVNAHSSFFLLTSNQFDENGAFTSMTHQSVPMQALERATAFLVEQIDELPTDGNMLVSNLLAAIVASIMSSDQSETYEHAEMSRAAGALSGYGAAVLKLFGEPAYESVNLRESHVYLALPNLKNVCRGFQESAAHIRNTAGKVEDVKRRLDNCLAIKIYTDRAMEKIVERLLINQKKAVLMGQLLEEILFLYEQKDRKIAELVR